MRKLLLATFCFVIIKGSGARTLLSNPCFLSVVAADTSKPKLQQPPIVDSTEVDTAKYTGKPGPVQVKGYYRKDGKYVAPYTRSAPRKKH